MHGGRFKSQKKRELGTKKSDHVSIDVVAVVVAVVVAAAASIVDCDSLSTQHG